MAADLPALGTRLGERFGMLPDRLRLTSRVSGVERSRQREDETQAERDPLVGDGGDNGDGERRRDERPSQPRLSQMLLTDAAHPTVTGEDCQRKREQDERQKPCHVRSVTRCPSAGRVLRSTP